ncbi:sugar MFS transporter [Rubellicoccus peritrichatus]|uniref:Sugar MFS transporter n=1 Tax=Rubellicoccus peritrichatus TaxID=3080537 RepID=A0AAQ3QV71_9BACT|nr:sugar MFS transporter [Puniceicoccus sp. CR14]WOO40605.1 sugar MFS transporter [Puniceicoccus sp. CR14]
MSSNSKIPIVPKQYLLAFILTTCCFSLWGFANDFTNPLVKVFEQVFIITTSQASWLQFAFYTGYFCMALPAVFFIRKFSYKAAIMMGLALYAIGALITIPASLMAQFALFCLASYVITYGLAFLETACNPYILAMGPQETATQRLNLAQSFNPIGSLIGMTVASVVLAPSLEVTKIRAEISEGNVEYTQYLAVGEEPSQEWIVEIALANGNATLKDGHTVTLYPEGLPDFMNTSGALDSSVPNVMKAIRASDPEQFNELQQTDLGNVRGPYMVIAAVVFTFFMIFAFTKMPSFKHEDGTKDGPFFDILGHLLKRARFIEGVFAQLFYVGAQIMCWTFVIHYGMTEVGLSLSEAQGYNIIAMIIFVSGRFICTFLMRFIRPSVMLFAFSLGGMAFTIGAIYLPGQTGLWSLVAISGCMSLMFPTIYGIALKGLKIEEAKLGSAFLIMSIVGGAVLTKLQGGLITDYGVRSSFWLPVGCFVLIAAYGLRCMLSHDKDYSEA